MQRKIRSADKQNKGQQCGDFSQKVGKEFTGYPTIFPVFKIQPTNL